MSDLFDNRLRDVIRQSASASPTPGGGSVSAIAACFGTAMASMVCNLTIGKKSAAEVEPQVRSMLETITGLMARLEELVDQDIAVFERLMTAYRLPKNTDDEIAHRQTILQSALKAACEVPLQTAQTCLDALKITHQLAPIGNKMAISDAGVAAVLIEASLQGVLLNVDINTPMIQDTAYVQQISGRKDELIREAEKLKIETMAIVKQRMS